MREDADVYSTLLVLILQLSPTGEGDICCLGYPTRYGFAFVRSHPCDVQAYQAVKDVDANYGALVGLSKSIEHCQSTTYISKSHERQPRLNLSPK